MVSYFKEKSAVAVFGLFIVSLVTRLFFLQHPPRVLTAPGDGAIYYLLAPFQALPAVAVGLLYICIVVVQALRINYAFNDIRMFPRSGGYTTALAYILLTALVPAWNNISSALVINSMMVWVLFRLPKMYNTQHPKTLVYNAGLIVSATIILYYPAMPVVLLAFIALAMYRPFRLNEWMILLMGILTPFYFYAGWLFLDNRLEYALQQLEIFEMQVIRPANLPLTITTFVFTAVTIFSGIYLWQANSGRMVIQVRKNWGILFFMAVLFIPGIFIIKGAWPQALLLAALPAAAFVSNTFQYPKKKLFPAVLFWLFVALIVYNNWFAAKF